MNQTQKYIIGAIIGVVIIGILVAIKNPGQTPTDMSSNQPKESVAMVPTAPEKIFNINTGSFYFTPKEMRVKKGDKVIINLNNEGGFHDLTLDAFNVKIGPITTVGQKSSAEFIADKIGTFEYYCNVGNHRQKGQKGLLIVE